MGVFVCGGAGSGDAVAQGAESGDGDLADVTADQEPGRVEPDADSGRGAGGDDVAGQQGDPGRDGGDQLGDVEDEVLDRGALADLAVDLGLHLKGLDVTDLVGGHG